MKSLRGRRNKRFRRGLVSLEAVLTLPVFLVTAILFYYLAIRGFNGLYEIIAIHISSPYG